MLAGIAGAALNRDHALGISVPFRHELTYSLSKISQTIRQCSILRLKPPQPAISDLHRSTLIKSTVFGSFTLGLSRVANGHGSGSIRVPQMSPNPSVGHLDYVSAHQLAPLSY